MKKVALIKMPWGDVNQGSIALGILKNALIEEQVQTDGFYLNVRMAKKIGLEAYNRFNDYLYLGEWMFSQHLFGKYGTKELKNEYMDLLDFLFSQPKYLNQALILREMKHKTNNIVDKDIPELIQEFLSNFYGDEYCLVGFTCTLGEHVAALLLAKKIKERYPHIKIAFGGPNVFGIQGDQTLKDFEWIDYIMDGEGEKSIVALVKNVLDGKFYERIPGVSFRKGKEIYLHEGLFPLISLDDSPIPDYTDYYKEIEGSYLKDVLYKFVVFESSRGCWWGQKCHCTFCGVNLHSIKYRVKSSNKVLSQLMELSARYGTKSFFASDSILSIDFFNDLIPELDKMKLGFNLFYQVKSNLTKEQICMLGSIGVKMIQPGIESLDTDLLKLMNKGVTEIQNIQFLKLCSEFNIYVVWNLLYKIPGEDYRCYEKTINTIPLISHLCPPSLPIKVNLNRYSPYFTHPEEYGIKNITPNKILPFIYPEEKVNIGNISYIFEFECDSLDNVKDDYEPKLLESINLWKKMFEMKSVFCCYSCNGDSIEILDNRPLKVKNDIREQRRLLFEGIESRIYLFCEVIRPFISIYDYTVKNSKEQISEEQVREILNRFVNMKLMYVENDKYLSLATLSGKTGN